MKNVVIGQRHIGSGHPVFVIAELSANHHQKMETALELIRAAKVAGADAIKLQTYTADTLTLDSDREPFVLKDTLWKGRRLYELYQEAHMPWEWHADLFQEARRLGLICFSTPFDPTAVEFLETLNVPAYKIASFELVDLPLIRTVAQTGKPMILSTGMATLGEIDEAVRAAREAGAKQIALLKCNSAYPAPPEEMNLRTIPHLAATFDVPVGLSDHTLEPGVAVAAVALGAVLIEKHLTLSRTSPGPDSAFSLEPNELESLVQMIRSAEKSLGKVCYEPTDREHASRSLRRSLFVTRCIKKGDVFDTSNVRSIRPSHGLHTRYQPDILGRRAACDIAEGTPLRWALVM